MYNFIHVPKIAGLSFLEIIKKHGDILINSGHTRIIDVHSIAFVKHPYDRLLDAYFYIMKGGRGGYSLDLEYQELLKPYTDFKNFVFSIVKDNLIEKIIHLRPMAYWLCDEEGKIIANRIFKIENIGDIDKFLAELGIEEKLSNIFVNMTYHDHYTDYLDAEVIAEINNLYSLDFELFGYKKL